MENQKPNNYNDKTSTCKGEQRNPKLDKIHGNVTPDSKTKLL